MLITQGRQFYKLGGQLFSIKLIFKGWAFKMKMITKSMPFSKWCFIADVNDSKFCWAVSVSALLLDLEYCSKLF